MKLAGGGLVGKSTRGFPALFRGTWRRGGALLPQRVRLQPTGGTCVVSDVSVPGTETKCAHARPSPGQCTARYFVRVFAGW